MFDWIAGRIWAIVTFVPALFVAEDSPNFTLIRAMFGLLLIVAILFMIVMLQQFWSTIARGVLKAFNQIWYKRSSVHRELNDSKH
jgi:hypothetical protein